MNDRRQSDRLVSPDRLHARLGSEPPQVVDVRGPAEFAADHLPDAVHIPLDELPARLSELSAGQSVVTY